MNPLGTRARADELARLLDGAFAGPVAAGPTGQYVALAGRLRSYAGELNVAATPRAEFRAALRTRLVAVASVQAANAGTAATPAKNRALESAVSWTQSKRAQRGIGVAAGAMASVVAVAGVAVAGSQSLPGDPFYGVKRGGESLELRAAGGAVAKGSKHLEFAAERLKEVRALSLGRDAAFAGSPEHPVASAALGGSLSNRVRAALADMDSETRSGSALLTAAYRDTHREATLQILSRFADRQSRDLTALLPALSSSTRPRAEESLALVSGLAVNASSLLAVGVCTGACDPAQSAPVLPPATGGPMPQPAPRATTDAPCGCQPAPEPTGASAPAPAPEPSTSPEPSPTPSSSPSPKPSPAPSASPAPVPVPTAPVPIPSLPVPVPTILPTPAGLSDVPGATVPAVPLI